MQPEPVILAYLAGVIDSDGYISINRSTRAGRTYFGAQVGIAGTRSQPHDLAASLWGGKVSLYFPKNPRHRPQYQWSRQGDVALGIIEALLPYLRVKEPQAFAAIELQENCMFGRCNDDDDAYPWFGPDYNPTDCREELVREIRDLNQCRRGSYIRDEFPAVSVAVTR